MENKHIELRIKTVMSPERRTLNPGDSDFLQYSLGNKESDIAGGGQPMENTYLLKRIDDQIKKVGGKPKNSNRLKKQNARSV